VGLGGPLTVLSPEADEVFNIDDVESFDPGVLPSSKMAETEDTGKYMYFPYVQFL